MPRLKCKAWQSEKGLIASIYYKNEIMLWVKEQECIYTSSIDRQSPLLLLYQNDLDECFKQLDGQGDIYAQLKDPQIVIKYQMVLNNDIFIKQIKLKTQKYRLAHSQQHQSSILEQKTKKSQFNQSVFKNQILSQVKNMLQYYDNKINKLQSSIIHNTNNNVSQSNGLHSTIQQQMLNNEQQIWLPLKIQWQQNQGKYFELKYDKNWYCNENKEEMLILNKKDGLAQWFIAMQKQYCNCSKITLKMKINLNKYHENDERYDIVFGLVEYSKISQFQQSLKTNYINLSPQSIPQSLSIVLINHQLYANVFSIHPQIVHEDLQDISELQIRLQLINNKQKVMRVNRVMFYYNKENVYEYVVQEGDGVVDKFSIWKYIPFVYIYHSIRHFNIKNV